MPSIFLFFRHPLGVSLFMVMIMTLQELAEEYFNNARELEKQIERKKQQCTRTPSADDYRLQKEIAILTQMYNEQMVVYHQLKNYYVKKL